MWILIVVGEICLHVFVASAGDVYDYYVVFTEFLLV